ncbi:DUF1643 domain-containing protein [Wenzhouxiangella marina]|uniref:Uncharacterized protein n=1 Tax=Wenzhouxiangella marina TaxID=1579979 RepID=A0A0K0XXE0_9GAMM|nr:DUF1643 domain-containing protein [Wenzhouxiangella marina]AKS42348.1 hypothetical protein WM2015_1982 [Wenzhouxiangella marina]MBB6085879.1 hypothetical protein [Wenzhouxiangella marina]
MKLSHTLSRPGGANFSRCRRYRYSLWRTWEVRAPKVMMIGLNPSTADAERNDPTIRRCIGFARDWGYGGLIMTNLFAFRATYPEDLRRADDPIGPRNDAWIRRLARCADALVAVWGNDGAWLDRSQQLRNTLGSRLQVIRLNKSGEPAHPLYLPARLRPGSWPEPDTMRSP